MENFLNHLYSYLLRARQQPIAILLYDNCIVGCCYLFVYHYVPLYVERDQRATTEGKERGAIEDDSPSVTLCWFSIDRLLCEEERWLRNCIKI